MSRDVRATAAAVPAQPVEPDIQLTLSPDVARTLRLLVGSIMGDPNNSYRRDTNEIYRALGDAGVRLVHNRFSDGSRHNLTARPVAGDIR